MTVGALVLAWALRTRLGQLWLAVVLLKAGNALKDAGSRARENVKAGVGKRR